MNGGVAHATPPFYLIFWRFALKNYKYLFFDLDGTVTDSCEGIYKSFVYALEYYGVKVDDVNSLRPILGPPLKDSFMNMFGFDEKKAEAAVAKYRERFSVKGLFENRVYDGVRELLSSLKGKGYITCLATSKPEEFAKRCLEYFKLDGLFDFITGATFDGARNTKEDVIGHIINTLGITDVGQILMIGDRKYDLLGAAEFGIDGLGVLYGYGSKEELELCPHIALADTPKDIEAFLIQGR